MLLLQLPNVDVDKIEAADSVTKANFSSTINTLRHSTPEEIWDFVLKGAESFLVKLVLVLLIWYVGRWLIRKLKKGLKNVFEHRKVDSSLATFLINLTTITLTILLVYILISVLGFNTSSFIALFASAGLAVGLALSGTLQNFAGGVMILLLKPYHVGDYIEAQGYAGTVKSIQLFNTIVTTSDNKTVIIPNGPMSTGIVNNYSKEPLRRVEWVIGVNYGDDFAQARTIIQGLVDKDARILKDPKPLIEILSLGDSAVNIVVRGWVKSGDFWDVFFSMNAQIYKTLPEKGIPFPYPTMDVHITQ